VGDYPDVTLRDAVKQYPFIDQYNPLISVGSGEGYAETWPADEAGDASYPRPKEFPMGRVGVQVFKPEKFTASDLAAEFLHVDPKANAARDALRKSMTPEQLQRLKRESADYSESIRMGQPEDRAVQNAIDSALRGYTTDQWPKEANEKMGYSAKQRQILDGLKRYMVTGK
jgi:hypothetical protein